MKVKSKNNCFPLNNPSIQINDSETLDQTIRKSIHEVYSFPFLILKLIGLFPFSVDLRNELLLSKLWSIISALHIFLHVQFVCTALFFPCKLIFKEAFGGENDTEYYTNLILIIGKLTSQIFIRYLLFKDSKALINFQNSINVLIVELAEKSNNENWPYGELFERKANKLKTISKVIAVLSILCGFSFAGSLIHSSISINASTWQIIILPLLTAHYNITFTAYSILAICAGTYIHCLKSALKILELECCENSTHSTWFIETLHFTIPAIVEKFNKIFSVHIISWILSTGTISVQQLFKLALWTKDNDVSVANKLYLFSALIPCIIANFYALYFLCTACTKFIEQV